MKDVYNPLLPDEMQKLTDKYSDLAITVVTKTAGYIATEDDVVILVDASAGDVLINLPTTSIMSKKVLYFIKKIDTSANKVTIEGTVD